MEVMVVPGRAASLVMAHLLHAIFMLFLKCLEMVYKQSSNCDKLLCSFFMASRSRPVSVSLIKHKRASLGQRLFTIFFFIPDHLLL